MVLGEGAGQWQKPLFAELKLNCDAVGWVFLDFAGIPKLVRGVGGVRFGATIMAEAEAIRQALETIMGCDVMEAGGRLVVYSDFKGLIQMLSKEIIIDVTLEIYLQDIWRMASLFQLVRFCFTPRQCNRVQPIR